jgi:hypothetical protein
VYLGDQNISGGVCELEAGDACDSIAQELQDAFLRSDFPLVFRLFDRVFGGTLYSLRNLFRDEQRKIINLILSQTLADTDAIYIEVFENHAPLMRFLTALQIPIPRTLQVAADLAVNDKLRKAFESESLDVDHIHGLLEQASSAGIPLDAEPLEFTLKSNIERMASDFYGNPLTVSKLDTVLNAVTLARSLPFWVDLWKAQNIYYEMLETIFPKVNHPADQIADSERIWLEKFRELGRQLQVFIP